MKQYLAILVAFLISFVWASVYWLGNNNLWQVEIFISTHLQKPWVYRQFIPFLTRTLSHTGIRTDIIITILISLCGVGFYLSLRAWLMLIYKDRDVEIFSLIGLSIGLGLFGYNRIPYDLGTAFFVTLSFYLIYKKDYKFFWVFPLAVFNRETSFLLIIFYVIYTGFSLMEMTYLISAFGAIQGLLRLIFLDNDGSSVWVEPWQNLIQFYNHPAQTVLHVSVAGLILFLVLYGSRSKDRKLINNFVVLSSLLTGMYLVLGQSFEVRVFWEIWSLVLVLSFPTVKEFTHEISAKIQKVQSYRKNSLPQTASGAVRYDESD